MAMYDDVSAASQPRPRRVARIVSVALGLALAGGCAPGRYDGQTPPYDATSTSTSTTASSAPAASSSSSTTGGTAGVGETPGSSTAASPTGAVAGGATSVGLPGAVGLSAGGGSTGVVPPAGTAGLPMAGGTQPTTTGLTSTGGGTAASSTSGGAACTAVTWANGAMSFFQAQCVACHANYAAYAGVEADLNRIGADISAGSMPPTTPLSATDKQTILQWLQCNAPQ